MNVFQALGVILICLSSLAVAQQPRNDSLMGGQIREGGTSAFGARLLDRTLSTAFRMPALNPL
jgi:hypothetical protein